MSRTVSNSSLALSEFRCLPLQIRLTAPLDTVVRNFIIIGEAASHLSEDFITRHSGFPWRERRDMRNIAVHEYFGVDNMIVWETLQKNLPPLLSSKPR